MSDFSIDAASAAAPEDRRRLTFLFGAAVVVSIVLGQLPWGRQVLYPFALLATWAHEMGHGIGALVTGNRFIDLELYSNLGGQARTAGADGFSQVVVSSFGLIGAAVLGAIVMIAGAREAIAPHVLTALAAVVGVSVIVWVRNLFGVVSMLAIAAGLGLIARFGPSLVRIVVAQVVAVQMALASWSTRDYLFVDGFERDGFQKSDTQRIADEWFLPYWFWGALLGGLSVVVLAWAFWVAWLRPLRPSS